MNYYTQQIAIARKALAPVIKENLNTIRSGIYLWKRTDEEDITWFYVGQAVNIYNRQIGHYNGYQQRIDFSLRKRKFKNEDNPYGWEFEILEFCDPSQLNQAETEYIRIFMKKGWQSYNLTYGSQGQGKQVLDGIKPSKGYRDGVSQGYENARREVAKLFKTYLKAEINGTQGVRAQNALQKFEDFIKGADK